MVSQIDVMDSHKDLLASLTGGSSGHVSADVFGDNLRKQYSQAAESAKSLNYDGLDRQLEELNKKRKDVDEASSSTKKIHSDRLASMEKSHTKEVGDFYKNGDKALGHASSAIETLEKEDAKVRAILEKEKDKLVSGLQKNLKAGKIKEKDALSQIKDIEDNFGKTVKGLDAQKQALSDELNGHIESTSKIIKEVEGKTKISADLSSSARSAVGKVGGEGIFSRGMQTIKNAGWQGKTGAALGAVLVGHGTLRLLSPKKDPETGEKESSTAWQLAKVAGGVALTALSLGVLKGKGASLGRA